MSANNELRIIELSRNKYVIREAIWEEGTGAGFEVGQYSDLKTALKHANRYLENNEVEYNYRVIFRDD